MQTAVDICFHPSGKVLIQGIEQEIELTIDQLDISPRLGNTRRNIFLPNAAKLETDDNAAVDKVCRYFNKNPFQALIHKLERNAFHALIALVITIAFIWGGIEYGVPVAAQWVAKTIPYDIEQKIGEQGLETLDKWLFSASKLNIDDQQRLQNGFNQLLTSVNRQYQYQLLIRNSQHMGANALALPGGIVIMTDGLFDLAENDDQILSVLAHEIGHIENQHGLRLLFQDSMTALLMAGLLGDISSVTSLSVAIPTILVGKRYSREFEIEADQYATAFLKAQNMQVEDLIRMLTLLDQTHETESEFDYIASHPAMKKRINLIEEQWDLAM